MTATASSDVAAVMERAKLSGPNKPVSPLDTRNVNEPGQAGHRPTSPDEVSPLTKSDQDTLTEDEPVSDLGAGPRGEGVGGRGSAMLSGSSSQNGAVLSPKTREQSAGGFPPEWLVEIKKIIKDESKPAHWRMDVSELTHRCDSWPASAESTARYGRRWDRSDSNKTCPNLLSG